MSADEYCSLHLLISVTANKFGGRGDVSSGGLKLNNVYCIRIVRHMCMHGVPSYTQYRFDAVLYRW